MVPNIQARFDRIAASRAVGSQPRDSKANAEKIVGTKFGELKVKEGMAFKLPKNADYSLTSYMAKIRGVVTAATREGQGWAGRKYRFGLDGDEVIVQRLEDGAPLPKRIGGGGRKKKDAAATTEAPKQLQDLSGTGRQA
jgi:hypothetical protein